MKVTHYDTKVKQKVKKYILALSPSKSTELLVLFTIKILHNKCILYVYLETRYNLLDVMNRKSYL